MFRCKTTAGEIGNVSDWARPESVTEPLVLRTGALRDSQKWKHERATF